MSESATKASHSPLRASLNRLRRRRRRTRSAPPGPRTRLIEEQFPYDSERSELFPGVIKHNDDLARDSHDFFNLIILIPVIALNVMNWNFDKMFNLKKKETYIDSWTGEWFDAFFYITLLYFMADLLWVLSVPNCVKSPSTIIQHHIITIMYMFIPYFRHDKRWGLGACMSVEINTWFLIARRVFNKEGFPPWIIDLSFVSVRIKIISICFYITWICIRCILYPFLLVYFCKSWLIESQKAKSYLNIEIIPLILQSVFCILNFKWTFDLFRSKIRYHYRQKQQDISHRL